jgi:hypothetical protein
MAVVSHSIRHFIDYPDYQRLLLHSHWRRRPLARAYIVEGWGTDE